jgi:hypothetical protein
MRLRSTGIAAGVLATLTLALTAAGPRPAEAFFFLPMLQNKQIDSGQRSSPTENRWRDDTARPIKRSTTTRSRDDDDDKPSSSSSRKGAKSTTKSEAKTNSGQTSRSWRAKQEPPTSRSSGRANTAVQRAGSGCTGSASTGAQQVPSGGGSTNTGPQQASSTGPGSTVGDTLDEKLGDVFKARIDELIKQPPK